MKKNKHQILSKDQKIISFWLLCCCILVFLMIVVGGLTRLTESGLSIVEWKPVTGAFPPISESSWQEYFTKYKASPQYQKINKGMSLGEFKNIFWLEYIHRLLGRITGLVFVLPFIFFIYRKTIKDPKFITKFSFILVLILIQAVVGWYMVKSGLKTNPYVSPVMLMFHMVMGAFIYSLTLYTYLQSRRDAKLRRSTGLYSFSWALILLVFCQIAIGALVAGLDAGLVYNTWPLMGDKFMATEVYALKPWTEAIFHHAETVQFNHRIGAIVVFIAAIALATAVLGHHESDMKKPAIWLIITVIAQFALGILTLIKQVPIHLASSHQALAIILLSFCLVLNYKLRPKS